MRIVRPENQRSLNTVAPDSAAGSDVEVSQASRRWGLWWLSPTGSVTIIIPATLYLAWIFDNQTYVDQWRTPKVLTTATILTAVSAVVVFMIAGLLPQFGKWRKLARPWPSFNEAQYESLAVCAKWVFRATIFGYIAMFGAAASRGARPTIFIDAFTGDGTSDALKDYFAPITGITTFTQVGIAYVVIATLLVIRHPVPYIRTKLLVVIGLGLFRAFFVSERLAIIELVFPIVAVLAMVGAGSPRARTRVLSKLAPILLVPAAIATFAFFEYFRSWTAYYAARPNNGFVAFALERFAGYYVTAYNNGQLALDYQPVDAVPYNSIAFLWQAPVISQLGIYEKLNHGPPVDWFAILLAHGNEELNNVGGIQEPFVDFGTIGGYIFFIAVGLVLGWLYLGFKNGSPMAVIVYPPLVTGLFEMPRYLYWTQGRFTPGLVALIITGYVVSNKKEVDLREGAPQKSEVKIQ